MGSTAKRIFMSYGHDEHAPLAARLKADLETRGHRVWLDESEIRHGRDWELAIEKGLSGTEIVLALLTPHAVRRPDGVCLDELSYARFRRLPILPLMVQQCQPPLSICRIQWLDMEGWAGAEEAYANRLERITAAIEDGQPCFEGTGARLVAELQPLDFRAELDENTRGFTGREWVLSRIDRWLADPGASRVFLLTAPPGAGKSAIASMVCQRHPAVAAFHLCCHGDSNKSDAHKCVLSLAYQLSTQLPEYRDRLLARDLRDTRGMNAHAAFDELIVQALYALPPPTKPVLLVVDALDEAALDRRNALAALFGQLFSRTPPWLRLLVTCRPEPALANALARLTPVTMTLAQPENLNDIRDHARRRLGEIAGHPVDEAIVGTILDRSEGVFLYLSVLLEELRLGNLSLDRPDEFPNGLASYYQGFFERQFGAQDAAGRARASAEYDAHQRPLLEVLAAAQEPLGPGLVRTALSWNAYDFKHAVDPLGSLILVGDESIRLFHSTVAEWLADQATDHTLFIDPEAGHRILAREGFRQFSFGVSQMSEYFCKFLHVHLIASGMQQELATMICSEDFLARLQYDFGTRDAVRVYNEALTKGDDSIYMRLWTQGPVECVACGLRSIQRCFEFGQDREARVLIASAEAPLLARAEPRLTSLWYGLAGRVALLDANLDVWRTCTDLSLRHAEASGNDETRAAALLTAGALSRNFGDDPREADQLLHEALESDFARGNAEFRARVLLNMAMVYCFKSEVAEADACLEEAAPSVFELGDAFLLAALWKYCGYVLLMRRDFGRAGQAFAAAAGHFGTCGRDELRARCISLDSYARALDMLQRHLSGLGPIGRVRSTLWSPGGLGAAKNTEMDAMFTELAALLKADTQARRGLDLPTEDRLGRIAGVVGRIEGGLRAFVRTSESFDLSAPAYTRKRLE